MKAILLTALLVGSLAASAQQPLRSRMTVPASRASETLQPISEQPEGQLITMQRSSHQFAEMNGSIAVDDVNTMAMVVFADNGDVYFKNYISVLSSTTPTWIKGHLDGETITIDFPQVIYTQEGQNGLELYTGYVFDDLYHTEEPAIPALSENQTITFSYVDGVMTQSDNRIAGIGLEMDGAIGFSGYGDSECVYRTFDKVAQTLPEGLTTEKWAMKSDAGAKFINVAIDDDMVYLQGIVDEIPEATIYGRIEGTKVVFDKEQYLGVYANTYFLFFMPLRGTQTFTESLKMTYDAEARVMKSDKIEGFAINANTTDLFAIATYKDITIEYQSDEDVPAVPMSPEDLQVSVLPEFLWEMIGVTEVRFNLAALSADGKIINADNMTYVIYRDDEILEFDPDHDPKLTEPMSIIPVNYADNWTFFLEGDRHDIYLWFDDFQKIGVQSFYTVDGVENSSPIVYSDGTTTAIHEVNASESSVPERYFDLLGRPVANPERGNFYIKVANGRSSKVIF